MTISTSVMLDTIGTSSHNIPKSTRYVAGYVTGLGDVPWTPADWAMFPSSRHIRIDQGAGHAIAPQDYDVLDVEAGAVTPQGAAIAVERRVNLGIQWTTIYGSNDVLAACTSAIKALGDRIWIGHVNYWLADWDLGQAQAASIVGSMVQGATCIGVQWASPASNPSTVVPGGVLTLADANVDISVVDANWSPSSMPTPQPPPPPPPQTHYGLLVTTQNGVQFAARQVKSIDEVHWQ